MKTLLDLIGLRIVAIKTYCKDKRRTKAFFPEFILMNDRKTIIKIEDQDYHDYHDCDRNAKLWYVEENPDLWKEIETNTDYRDSDICYPLY